MLGQLAAGCLFLEQGSSFLAKCGGPRGRMIARVGLSIPVEYRTGRLHPAHPCLVPPPSLLMEKSTVFTKQRGAGLLATPACGQARSCRRLGEAGPPPESPTTS